VSAAVEVDRPVSGQMPLYDEAACEGFGAGPGEALAPTAPSGFFDADGQNGVAAREVRRDVIGADGKARERRYPLHADEDLMRLVGLGDAAAFAVLYDRHGRAAYSLAYRMMGERQAAEDLTQDVFLKVWRSAGGYRAGRGSVRTWILSIVHNRSIDQMRSLASRRRTQEKVESEAPRSQPSEAFAEAWRGALRDQVREALGKLPSEQLEILELAYFSGHTQVEIARMLDLPLGTVKGRTRLGLKKLGGLFHPRVAATR
jgi:RNA polymerase sigma-70 factor, ECF subfamily